MIINYISLYFHIEHILKRILNKNKINVIIDCLKHLCYILNIDYKEYTLKTLLTNYLFIKAKERSSIILKIYHVFFGKNNAKTLYYRNIINKEKIIKRKIKKNSKKKKNNEPNETFFFFSNLHPESIIFKYYEYLEFRDLCVLRYVNKYFTYLLSYNPTAGCIDMNNINTYILSNSTSNTFN